MSAGGTKNWWRHAPALRFLALFFLTWAGARAASPYWMGDEAAAPAVAQEAAPAAPLLGVKPPMLADAVPLMWPEPRRPQRAVSARKAKAVARRVDRPLIGAVAVDVADTDTELFVPPLAALAGAEPASVAVARRDAEQAPENVAQDGDGANSLRTGRAGWSLSAWALLREKSDRNLSRHFVGELAGSQAGARLAYGLGHDGRVQLYGRASLALHHAKQSEAALGVSVRPVAAVPLDVAVERRQKLGADGRNAMAAMLVGGVSGQALPLDFKLDAYAQTGVVGLQSKDLFVDGAVVVDRAWQGAASPSALRFGVVVAGAAQPDVSRLDVGPRVTVPLPKLGQGMRVALDYRSRIAGNAAPQNGLALTIGADF